MRYEDNKEEFCRLRDTLSTRGLSIYYDSFYTRYGYVSIRHIYFEKSIYLMKRIDRRCVEIINLKEQKKIAEKEYKEKLERNKESKI